MKSMRRPEEVKEVGKVVASLRVAERTEAPVRPPFELMGLRKGPLVKEDPSKPFKFTIDPASSASELARTEGPTNARLNQIEEELIRVWGPFLASARVTAPIFELADVRVFIRAVQDLTQSFRSGNPLPSSEKLNDMEDHLRKITDDLAILFNSGIFLLPDFQMKQKRFEGVLHACHQLLNCCRQFGPNSVEGTRRGVQAATFSATST